MKVVLFGLSSKGLTHYASQFANALLKRSEVYAVVSKYSDLSFFDKKVKLIKLDAPHNVSGAFIKSLNLGMHVGLAKKIRKLSPDVVHFLDIHPWYPMYAFLLKNQKKYFTLHDPQPHSGERESVKDMIVRWSSKNLAKRSDRVFVHGKNMISLAAEAGFDTKNFDTIPHGTYEFFTKWAKKGVKSKNKSILFFGRIIQYKGVDTLLKATKILVKKIPDLKVVIAGEGDFGLFSRFLTKDIKDNVSVVNRYIPEEEVSKFFQESEFVVLPYDDATQSGVIPIAYSFKKPVISTRVGSLPEVIDEGRTGMLIPPKNSKALADAIIKMFDSDTKKMGELAYKKMKDVMDWGKIVEKTYKDFL